MRTALAVERVYVGHVRIDVELLCCHASDDRSVSRRSCRDEFLQPLSSPFFCPGEILGKVFGGMAGDGCADVFPTDFGAFEYRAYVVRNIERAPLGAHVRSSSGELT